MFFSLLLEFLKQRQIQFLLDVKTADLVSFKIGGLGKIAVFPKNIGEFVSLINFVKKEKHVIIGNGTNCFFSNEFYDGIIIVTKNLNKARVSDNAIIAECGASVSRLCNAALEMSLSGLEFAYGIPGSIGGAVYMNASAFGGEFSQLVHKSTVLDTESGDVISLNNKELRGKIFSFQEEQIYNFGK